MAMHERNGITRRDILRRTSGLAGLYAFNGFAKQPAILEQLDYSQVTFGPGPLERQFRENHALVLSLNEDSLLKPYRQREGLPAPGPDMGGWYDTYALGVSALLRRNRR
jgi:hypothetical protein